MNKIRAEELSFENFHPFGSYSDLLSPSGPKLQGQFHEFYRDQAKYYFDSRLPLGISPLVVKNHGYLVDQVEWHNHSCEMILPLNDDIVLHVTLAGDTFHIENTHAFIVPKGTAVVINPGVYHLTPLPVHADVLNALVLLPERAYTNDFEIMDLNEDQCFEIVLR